MLERCEEVVESTQNVHNQVCFEATDTADVVIAEIKNHISDYM